MRNILNKMFYSICIVFIAFSCSNPASSDDGHTTAYGLALEDSTGQEVYKQLNGVITGTISIPVGGSGLELSVHLLNQDGSEIAHEEDHEGETEEEEELLVASGHDTNIATVEVESHDESEGEEEEHGMGIHLTGVSVGSTSFTLQLMHGDHPDFTSLDIEVTVE